MKTFKCQCGNTLHFANSQCVSCSAMLGFIPDDLKLSALTPHNQKEKLGLYQASNGRLYKQCKNYWQYNVCNWMVPIEDSHEHCLSCRLNITIPNLSIAENHTLWFRMESSKRRLLYTLFKLGLPVVDRQIDTQHGLGFSFLEDQVEDEYGNELTLKNYVVSGHSYGLITLNLNEADPSARVEMREKMNESYRTLIGHFRHESGHYYWDRLVKDSERLTEFRALFGDETINYKQSLDNYYANGPSDNWQNVWISAYASMHPWEDWAETWAHYLHMVDTLETASSFDFSISGHQVLNPLVESDHYDKDYTAISFTQLFNDWTRLTVALNAVNRSMGMDDAYPFVISITALDKLRFIHETIKYQEFS